MLTKILPSWPVPKQGFLFHPRSRFCSTHFVVGNYYKTQQFQIYIYYIYQIISYLFQSSRQFPIYHIARKYFFETGMYDTYTYMSCVRAYVISKFNMLYISYNGRFPGILEYLRSSD